MSFVSLLSLCHPILQFGLANIFFNFLNFVFTLGHPRPPKRCPNWMLIFVVMGDQVQDDMALKFLIFTLGKILQNFFSKIDGNSRASPQCEKSKKFFYNYFLGIKHLCHCANTTIVAFQMADIIEFEF